MSGQFWRKTQEISGRSVFKVSEVFSSVNLAAYLEGGPACTSVGALTFRAGLAHVPIGPNTTYIQHSTHNIGQCSSEVR